MKKITAVITTFLLLFFQAEFFAQENITEIYSDFDGFWQTSSSSISSITPDTSHNLLGFKTDSGIYSTGVNDALLTSKGIVFNPQEFIALPSPSSIDYGYIGVGHEYGGSGNISPVPVENDPGKYLTDGINGLDLGTAIFNSTGTITYEVGSIKPEAIADGIPDIIVTQVGDPSAGSEDVFKFVDINGVTVGNELSVKFMDVASVGDAKWKFYDKNLKYQTSLAGTRNLRLVTFEFTNFGITAGNINEIKSFIHVLSGTSDQSFVAYNNKSIVVLPVEMLSFTAKEENRKVRLEWATATETNNAFFTIERTIDGKNWTEIAKIQGAGNTSTQQNYFAYDQQPHIETAYYRISQTDFDGAIHKHPHLASVIMQTANAHVVFPNPTQKFLTITDSSMQEQPEYKLISVSGKDVTAQVSVVNTTKNSLTLDVENLPSGMYIISLSEKHYPFVVNFND